MLLTIYPYLYLFEILSLKAPTDKINDGFYDMGPMRPNGKFYALDDLFQNPVNDKRPIIIVYAPDE